MLLFSMHIYYHQTKWSVRKKFGYLCLKTHRLYKSRVADDAKFECKYLLFTVAKEKQVEMLLFDSDKNGVGVFFSQAVRK